MPQFQCGGVARRLPDVRIGHAKLVIRVDDVVATGRIIFRNEKKDVVSVGEADGFLKAGESVEINGGAVEFASDISILDTSDNPIVFWGIL